jgi:hypothetical protein
MLSHDSISNMICGWVGGMRRGQKKTKNNAQ